MKTIHTMAMGAMLVVGLAKAATFDSIPFNTPTYSAEDPLGVSAIQAADTKAGNAAAAASAAQNKADAVEAKAAAIETSMETITNSVTKSGDVVVVGSMKGTSQDVGLLAGTNSIVLAVDRDADDIVPEDGQILLASDTIKLDAEKENIYIGSETLATLLGSSGEANVIVTVKTNGVDMVPDSNRAIDISIPAPGEGNVIEVVKVNGTALVPDASKAVDITVPPAGDVNVIEGITVNGAAVSPDASKVVALAIPDAGQSNVVETIKVNGTALVPDSDKAVDITIPAPGESNVVETVKVNGVALVPDSDKAVDIAIPAPGESNVVVTVKVNGSALVPDADRAVDIAVPSTFSTSAITDLDSYKNPTISAAALTAIDGINDAQDIATIKSTLTNFLNQFVIPAP